MFLPPGPTVGSHAAMHVSGRRRERSQHPPRPSLEPRVNVPVLDLERGFRPLRPAVVGVVIRQCSAADQAASHRTLPRGLRLLSIFLHVRPSFICEISRSGGELAAGGKFSSNTTRTYSNADPECAGRCGCVKTTCPLGHAGRSARMKRARRAHRARGHRVMRRALQVGATALQGRLVGSKRVARGR